MLVQNDTTPAELARVMGELLGDRMARERMAQAARSLGKPMAHAHIVDALEGLR